jgi:hypothetical protein
MRTKSAVVLAFCGFAALMTTAVKPQAQSSPNIVWQTTFANCPDWNQFMGLSDDKMCAVGDGLQGWGAWTTANGNGDSITAAANNPNGGGGKGYRSMVGDGGNNSGGGFRIWLPSVMSELWLRYYMRHQAGFGWEYDQPHYEKDLYFNDTAKGASVFVFGYLNGHFGVTGVQPGTPQYSGFNTADSWQGINGGKKGDGKWHYFEVHVKMDTNGANGIAETWVDGVHTSRFTNANFGGGMGYSAWQYLSVAINQHFVINNGVDMGVDYDDFAVSSNGYIGPVNGGGGGQSSQLPSAPANLRIAP